MRANSLRTSVRSYRDELSGVEAWHREEPDYVLLDVRMPGLDGPAAGARIRALVRRQRDEVSLVCDVPDCEIDADESLLQRVLENLVENAIRHAPEGSQGRLCGTVE